MFGRSTIDRERRSLLALGQAKTQTTQQPPEIEVAVAYAGGVGVTQQVITAINIEGAADGTGQIRELMTTVHQLGDARRSAGVALSQGTVDFGARVKQDG